MKKGISLIILVITIMVMIIIAGAVINALNRDDTLDQAFIAKTTSQLDNIQQKIGDVVGNASMRTKKDLTPLSSEISEYFLPIEGTTYYNLDLKKLGFSKVDLAGVFIMDETFNVYYVDADEFTLPEGKTIPTDVFNKLEFPE